MKFASPSIKWLVKYWIIREHSNHCGNIWYIKMSNWLIECFWLSEHGIHILNIASIPVS